MSPTDAAPRQLCVSANSLAIPTPKGFTFN